MASDFSASTAELLAQCLFKTRLRLDEIARDRHQADAGRRLGVNHREECAFVMRRHSLGERSQGLERRARARGCSLAIRVLGERERAFLLRMTKTACVTSSARLRSPTIRDAAAETRAM